MFYMLRMCEYEFIFILDWNFLTFSAFKWGKCIIKRLIVMHLWLIWVYEYILPLGDDGDELDMKHHHHDLLTDESETQSLVRTEMILSERETEIFCVKWQKLENKSHSVINSINKSTITACFRILKLKQNSLELKRSSFKPSE